MGFEAPILRRPIAQLGDRVVAHAHDAARHQARAHEHLADRDAGDVHEARDLARRELAWVALARRRGGESGLPTRVVVSPAVHASVVERRAGGLNSRRDVTRGRGQRDRRGLGRARTALALRRRGEAELTARVVAPALHSSCGCAQAVVALAGDEIEARGLRWLSGHAADGRTDGRTGLGTQRGAGLATKDDLRRVRRVIEAPAARRVRGDRVLDAARRAVANDHVRGIVGISTLATFVRPSSHAATCVRILSNVAMKSFASSAAVTHPA